MCFQSLASQRAVVLADSKVTLPRQLAPNSTTSDDVERRRLQRVGEEFAEGKKTKTSNNKMMRPIVAEIAASPAVF
jgi:hypothetical protein